MGIIPLGTGNVVANNLGLPKASPDAASRQVNYLPRRIAAGCMKTTLPGGQTASRYFLAAAGLGMHARMIEEAHAKSKSRSGMMAYYRSGFRLMFLEPVSGFDVDLTLPDGSVQSHRSYELLAVKVALFSGIVKRWRPGSSLEDPVMRFLLVKSPSRAVIFAGTLRCIIGGSPKLRAVEIIPVRYPTKHPASSRKPMVSPSAHCPRKSLPFTTHLPS
jgi:diacylglycerol kinase family enzyme